MAMPNRKNGFLIVYDYILDKEFAVLHQQKCMLKCIKNLQGTLGIMRL